jgi:NADH-quinone oxidoreductase subunit M
MLESIGILLVVLAALVRKGVFPFHAWVPEVFDRGRLGPAILFSTPQIGAYVTAVLVLPRAAPETLRVVAVLALLTAVYGAALAVVQSDARRACGYLFVSQSALVMAGLDCTSDVALAGGLTLWLSSAIAFAGLSRCVLLLEGRRGRLPLSRFHGGHDDMPGLATAFLLTGLACTGFPGTLGFVGGELLVDGAVEAFPVLGFAVVLAGLFTGIAVLRMYLALFCGRSERATHLGLRPRESWAFAALAVLLIATGLVPDPIVRSRVAAAEDLLQARHDFDRR